MLKELWVEKQVGHASAQAGADKDAIGKEFKTMFETVLDKSAPIMTDMLGTHEQLVENITKLFEDRVEKAAVDDLKVVAAELKEAMVYGGPAPNVGKRNGKAFLAIEKQLGMHAALVTGR